MASIFRQKSLDKMVTPDHLDDYIRVSNPSVWLVLGAIVVLLVAATVWGVFGHITESTTGVLVVKNGSATCYIEQTKADDLDAGDAVSAANTQGMVTTQPAAASPAADADATDGMAASLWGEDAWVVSAEASIDLPDGVYQATIDLETYAPLALLLGGR